MNPYFDSNIRDKVFLYYRLLHLVVSSPLGKQVSDLMTQTNNYISQICITPKVFIILTNNVSLIVGGLQNIRVLHEDMIRKKIPTTYNYIPVNMRESILKSLTS